MPNAKEILDQQFLEMRWRCLSLAADLDRIERARDGGDLVESDPRLRTLRQAVSLLFATKSNRAEQVQMLFSDESTACKENLPQSTLRTQRMRR